jgi:hypothetical protein
VEEAAAAMVQHSRTVLPDPGAHAAYAPFYAAYCRLYGDTRGAVRDAAEAAGHLVLGNELFLGSLLPRADSEDEDDSDDGTGGVRCRQRHAGRGRRANGAKDKRQV